LPYNTMKRQKGGVIMNHGCGCSNNSNGGISSAAFVLVLFILLVIIIGAVI